MPRPLSATFKLPPNRKKPCLTDLGKTCFTESMNAHLSQRSVWATVEDGCVRVARIREAVGATA